MKHLKRFNEAIVVPDKKNLEKLYKEIESNFIESRIHHMSSMSISFDSLKEISSKYNINIVTYDEFYNLLSDSNKKSAPPKGVPMFGYTNSKTGEVYVILNRSSMDDDYMFDHFKDTVEHELVHASHTSKADGWYPIEDSGPNNDKSYFSDKSEIMAMSKSISYLILKMNPKSIEDAMKMLKRNQLYSQISREVDEKTLKRYHKYVYLYLEDHFDNKDK